MRTTLSSALLVAAFASLSSLVACGDPTAPPPPETTSIYPTNTIEASFSAQADATKLTVYAALLHGSAFLRLDGGDFLVATVAGQPVTLVEVDAGNEIHYEATLPAPTEAIDVTIGFQRPAGKASAPSSRAVVPAPFQLGATPASFRVGGSIVVPATNVSPNDLKVDMHGPCIDASRSDATSASANASSVTIDSGSIPFASAGTGCTVNVDVRLETLGDTDVAFLGGLLTATGFEGLQHRGFSVALTR